MSAYAFDLGQVRLTAGRWLDNQNRTLSYLRFVDVDRLLYNFRANHRLSTNGAAPNGGWDAPTFPFRTHMQGHFLTAWAQAYAVLGDTTCRDKANHMVAELAKCQANNGAAGFNTGYLSGFPESDFTALEARTLSNGNVPYYCVHKTMAGLLDVWRYIGSTQARDVLLALAGWVDWRTGRLSDSQMQSMLGTEFGGMNAVLTDLYQQTGDARWLTAAQRFDHAAVFNPLASNQDQLNGLHANTQVPKWIGAAREYKATGTTRYRDIAANAWNITVNAHTYAIGGNSQAEHFRAPNAIAGYLTNDTCEHCNTYNMLKLTRELWLLNPNRAVVLRLLRAGAAQPRHRRAEPGRRPRARHLLHPAQARRPPWRRPGVGRRHLEHRLQLLLVLPGHRAGDQHEADGLHLLLQRHHADREPVHAVGAELDPARHHGHPDDVLPGERHRHPAGHRQRQRLLVDARPHPGLDDRRDDQRQRRAAERRHHPRHVRHPHPLVDRPATPSPSACRCGWS